MSKRYWEGLLVVVLVLLMVFAGRMNAVQQAIFRDAQQECLSAGYPGMKVIPTYAGKEIYCVNAMEAVRLEEVRE